MRRIQIYQEGKDKCFSEFHGHQAPAAECCLTHKDVLIGYFILFALLAVINLKCLNSSSVPVLVILAYFLKCWHFKAMGE